MAQPFLPLPFPPMEPLPLSEPFQDDAFWYEVKWDGIRALVWRGDGQVRIWSRKGKEVTPFFPELQMSVPTDSQPAVLDGEIIVVDETRRPDFSRVVRRLRLKNPAAVTQARRTSPVVLMVFDLLWLGNEDLRSTPLWYRRQRLRQTVIPSAHVQVVESFDDGMALFRATGQMGLEGIVAKRRESRYAAGKRHRDWFKVKHFQELEACIGGLRRHADGTGRSVLLGLPGGDGRLIFIGQAAAGLKDADWKWLQQRAETLRIPSPPFAVLPVGAKDCLWLKPALKALVRFQGWTASNHLRSPVILRLL